MCRQRFDGDAAVSLVDAAQLRHARNVEDYLRRFRCAPPQLEQHIGSAREDGNARPVLGQNAACLGDSLNGDVIKGLHLSPRPSLQESPTSTSFRSEPRAPLRVSLCPSNTRSRVAGISQMRLPVALYMALTMAGAASSFVGSPTDLAPHGPLASSFSTMIALMCGTSIEVAIRYSSKLSCFGTASS